MQSTLTSHMYATRACPCSHFDSPCAACRSFVDSYSGKKGD